MEKYDLVCAGVACLDIVVSGNISPDVFCVDSTAVNSIRIQPGGDGVNESITASSLGMKTALISCIGNDWKGDILNEILQSKEIDLKYTERKNEDATVSAIVLVLDDGQRNFLFDRGCGETYIPSHSALEAVRNSSILSIASLFVLPQFDLYGVPVLLEEARNNNAVTVADVSCDTLGEGMRILNPILPLMDYFIPSLEEARILSGKTELTDIYKVLASRGLKNLVIKLGADGCSIQTPKDSLIVPTFHDMPVVDTTGCGDNFVAAFCYGLLNCFPLEECALFANAAASINAGFLGGSGHLKSSTDIKEFLDRNRHKITIKQGQKNADYT